jgi:hypothetical protein
VVAVGNNAFNGCSGLTGSLTIPNSVVTINSEAFLNCVNLTGTLSIGAGVTNIVQRSFDGYRFADIIIDLKNTTYGLATNVGEAKIVVKKSSGFIVNYTINDTVQAISRLAIGKLTIPNSVTTIGNAVFADCSGLTGELIIPDNVVTISGKPGQYGAFVSCSGFTSLHLGSKVQTIENFAFAGCSGMKGSLIFPPSLSTVRREAFKNSTNFTSLTFSNDNMYFDKNWSTFAATTQIKQIIFKNFNNLNFSYGNILRNMPSAGTLVTSGGSISNDEALVYAKLQLLPQD